MQEPRTVDLGQGLSAVLHGASGRERARVLCFHGGGGVDGDPEMIAPLCRLIGRDPGVSVWAVRYRTLNRDSAALPDMLHDAARALSRAREDLAEGVDLHVMGASFGALLGLHAVIEDAAGVSGLILLNPVVETGSGGFVNRVIRPNHGDLSPLARWEGHALTRHLRCLIVHGGRDDVVPVAAARRFAALWPEDRCHLEIYPGAGHGFFNRAQNGEKVAGLIRAFATGSNLASVRRAEPGGLPEGVSLLYGIGAQKAGTSWLCDLLGGSPDCLLPPVKEVHYFDTLYAPTQTRHFDDRLVQLNQKIDRMEAAKTPEDRARLLKAMRLLARVLQIHSGPPQSHRAYLDYLLKGRRAETVLCDVTPSYSVLDAAAFRQMDRLGPAKFIFLLRDPVDRLWSQIRMMAQERAPADDVAFEAACAEIFHERRAAMASLPRANYARTIRELEAAIPLDRILYLFHEEMFSKETADRICRFLDIDPVSLPPGPVNPGRPLAIPPEFEDIMLTELRAQYRFVLNRFGAAVPQAWKARLDRVRPSRQQRPSPGAAPGDTTIVFLHIPKTAGQTVVSEMRRLIGEKAFSPVRTHTQAAPDAQLPAGYRVHAGHIDWVDLETLPEDRFSFTILRDPRERIASFYFYLLREAGKLSAEELQKKERTGMRMISSRPASEYFFGGDPAWQRFVKDHYDNFYCNYFVTRKIRGSKLTEQLDHAALVEAACDGASAIDRIYPVWGLGDLERDLGELLGGPVKLQGNYLNAGPKAGHRAGRWQQLVDLLEDPEDVARLEGFAAADLELMRRLGLDPDKA